MQRSTNKHPTKVSDSFSKISTEKQIKIKNLQKQFQLRQSVNQNQAETKHMLNTNVSSCHALICFVEI